MKVPTWATVVGVLMILLGGCGALNNVQKINTPKALDETSGFMNEITGEIQKSVKEERAKKISRDSSEVSESDTTEMNPAGSGDEMDEVLKKVGDMMHFSDYYKKWIVRIGILGVIVSLIYAVSGVILIIGKPFAVKLAYIAIGLSFAALVFQIAILSADQESGMIASMTNFGAYFMIFINIILLVIILASDKSYFHQFEIIQE